MSIEIERKFLLSEVPDWCHVGFESAEALDMEQVYLRVIDGVEERIRRVSRGADERYYHAWLATHRSGVREVTEFEVSCAQYEALRCARDPARKPIIKRRWCFFFQGQLFELDVITQPRSRACCILERQVTSEDEKIILPDFVTIEREVTGERAYSNADIATG